MTLKPIKENENTGFYYEVTREQITQHQKYSVEEILYWLEDMNKFLREVQTEEEWNNAYLLKNKRNTYSNNLQQLRK